MAEQRCTQEEMELRAQAEFARRRQGEDINRMMEVALTACSAQDQWLSLSHTMAPWEVNPLGTMHGALITYLLDAAMAMAVRSCTGDHLTPTMDLHVNFIRAVRAGETVYAKAFLLQTGRKYATLRAELWSGENGPLCAAATGMYYRADTPAKA